MIRMKLELLLLFLPACFALNMAPGANNLLSITNSTRHGFAVACWAGVGRLVAFAGMIAIAAAGLAVVLQTSEVVFLTVKIAGALYLFYLAIQLWRAPVEPACAAASARQRPSLPALAKQEFWVAAGNPKAILIFTAFLPQFIEVGQPAAPQFAVLGGLFLMLEWVAIAAYAYIGSHLGRWFAAPRRRQLFNRACGSLLGLAGLGLLTARRA